MFLQVCVCPQGGAAIPACIADGIPACLAGFQAQTQGGSLGGSGWGSPGPYPRGSRGESGPGPWPRGKLRGIWSRPTPKGDVEGDLAGGCLLLRAVCILLECILVFRWFKFTLKPPYSIAHDKLRLALWDTSFWTFWLKFGHKGLCDIS